MQKIYTHIFFWFAVILLLTVIFGEVFDSFVLSFYFVSMLLPVAIGTSYLFNYYLVPKFLFKERYGRFILYFFYLLIFSTYLEMWVITGSFVLLADLNYRILSPIVTNIYILAVVLYFIVFLQAFILLLRRSSKMQREAEIQKSEKNKFKKGYLTVRADRRQANILYEDILYIESMGDYLKIVREETEPVITLERISHILKELPESFLRIHRSYIVNRRKVEFFSKTELQINGTKLPVSRTYKKRVHQQLSGK